MNEPRANDAPIETPTNVAVPTKVAKGCVVGMDMKAPFSVYVDGVEVAQHENEHEASLLYNRLLGRTAMRGVNDAAANVCAFEPTLTA